jgi:hypothetical protein
MRLPTLRKGQNGSSYVLVSVLKYIPACGVFLAGLIAGHLYGTLSQGLAIMHTPASADQPTRTNTGSSGDGWNTINVFYGSTDHAVSLLPKDQKWFAQARQDEAILSLLGNKRNGFFVDLAANDATKLSNTYALERHFGWKGLCVEPNPMYWYSLTRYRPNCELVAAVVGQKRMEEVDFLFQFGDRGGIVGKDFDIQSLKKGHTSSHEYTVTLKEVFDRYGVPKEIDYLSLDVEGAEEFIMQNFPLEDYKVKLMTVERPSNKLRELLKSHGFQQMQTMAPWGETLWTHKDVLSELDMSHLDDFSAKQYLADKALRNKQKKVE